MKSKTTLLLGIITSSAMVSCVPPQAPPQPSVNQQVGNQELVAPQTTIPSAASQGEVIETPSSIATEPSVPITSDSTIPSTDSGSTITETLPDLPDTPVDTGSIVPKPTVKPVTYPYAVSVPNKPGFVFNPYTQSKVDVRGLPSGTLVTDPRDKTQKFYVP